jgi:predicted metalloendopeptidase
MAPYLSDAFAVELFDFFGRTLRGQEQQKARWKRVLSTMEGQIGQAIGQRYVERWFPPASKIAMEALVANLRAALNARLARLAWMTPKPRRRALEVETFVPKIGYPTSGAAGTASPRRPTRTSATSSPPRSSTATGRWARSASPSIAPSGR